jgi:hypothetical protein
MAMSDRPTLLRVLVAERHWQKYETFVTQYERAANELAIRDHDPRLRGLSIAKRQFGRWLAGTVKTAPYPDHCRVLEDLFGRRADELLAPIPQLPQPAGAADLHPASGLAGTEPPAQTIAPEGSSPSVAGETGGWAAGSLARTKQTEQEQHGPQASPPTTTQPASVPQRGDAVVSHGRVRLEWSGSVTRVELPGVPGDATVELSEVGGGLHRRVLVRIGGLLVAEALLSRIDAERLVWARSNPGRIDLHLVGDLRAITLASVQAIHRASPVGLLAPARSHLEYLTELLRAGPPSQVERPLRLVTGEAAIVAGWLAFLSNDRAEAQRCYDVADELARQAGDELLAAQARIPMSYLHSPRYNGQNSGGMPSGPATALRLLDEAGRAARRLSPPMRGWLAGCAAAEHASLRNADAARAQLHRAADALADIRPGEEQQFLALWESTRLDSYAGLCAILLADGRQAEQTLRRALEHADPALVRHRVGILIDLGVACLLQHKLDEGCDDLGAASTLAAQHGLPVVEGRILSVRRQRLSLHSDHPAVRALDERLHQALATASRPLVSPRGAGDPLVERQA